MSNQNKPNQELVSNAPASLQARQTKPFNSLSINRNIKGIMKTVLCLFLVFSFFNASANDERKVKSSAIEFYNDVADFSIEQEKDLEFYVDYMLDAEGKPYIISVKSKNKNMTHMVKKMINGQYSNNIESNGDWYIITFLYNHIQ